jgi:hypothetical protein
MKILYVPHWLTTTLRGKPGVSQKTYTDIPKLLSIVSEEDVGFYIYLNMNLTKLIPPGIHGTFENYGSELADQLFRLGSDKSQEVMRNWDQYSVDANARPVENKDHVLTCDLGDEKTIVFTHVPPTHETLATVGYDPLLWLYDRVIRQYHPFVSIEELAETPLFLEYLRTRALAPGEETENVKNAPKVAENSEGESKAA